MGISFGIITLFETHLLLQNRPEVTTVGALPNPVVSCAVILTRIQSLNGFIIQLQVFFGEFGKSQGYCYMYIEQETTREIMNE